MKRKKNKLSIKKKQYKKNKKIIYYLKAFQIVNQMRITHQMIMIFNRFLINGLQKIH